MRFFGRFAVIFAAGAISIAIGAGSYVFADDAASMPARQTVVELFTSQGCSSCPPADALLRELSKRPDIIALSIHVNYWDYIGWKDPFASDETTARQHLYADSLHQRYVYTPEMVIDGYKDVTGSYADEVSTLIGEAAKRDRPVVPVVAKSNGGGHVTVSVPGGATKETATVWLFEFDREHVTKVDHGENGGRTLTDANVVRAVKKLGVWTGAPLQLMLAGTAGAAYIAGKIDTRPIPGPADKITRSCRDRVGIRLLLVIPAREGSPLRAGSVF